MKLFQHQTQIINEDRKKTGLFLGTGSAKTLTTLLLARGSILCITPKQQREEMNFIREAKKWGLDKDITQISKEDFKKQAPYLTRFDTVIIDEAHTVTGITPSVRRKKGQTIPKASQIYDMLVEYLEKYPPERLYLLTATPTRSPMCVYGLARLLGKKWNFYEFRDTFYTSIRKGFREFFIPRPSTKERLGKAVRSLGYTGKLEDYVDMPPQVYKTVYVSLKKEQKERLKEISIEYPDPLVGGLKSHQVENGTLTGTEFSEAEFFDNEKIEKILDYALEFPKMVIFAKYTLQIEQIKQALKGYNVSTLQGDTKDRKGVLEAFNSALEGILIAQSTISAGWESPDTPVMIFASLDWSSVSHIQGLGRINRINNPKRNLYIYLVTKGGMDERVYNTVVKLKMDFHLSIYDKSRK